MKKYGLALVAGVLAALVQGAVCLGQQPWAILQTNDLIQAVTFSPDGKTLAIGEGHGKVVLFEVLSGGTRATLQGHDNPVLTLAYSPDGRFLASGNGDGRGKLWDLRASKAKASQPKFDGYVAAVAFSPNSKVLAWGAGHSMQLWDVATGKAFVNLDFGNNVRSVAFSRDGKLLAAGGCDGRVRLWELKTCRQRAACRGTGKAVLAVSFNPHGNVLLSADEAGMVTLHDTISLTGLRSIRLPANPKGVLAHVVFSPDGKMLAFFGPGGFSGGGQIKLFEMAKGRQLASLGADSSMFILTTFSPDGRFLASAEDDAVRLWEIATLLKAEASREGRAHDAWRALAAAVGRGGCFPGGMAGGLFLCLSPGGSGISRENYERIEAGMKLQEVERILGEPPAYKEGAFPHGLSYVATWTKRGVTLSLTLDGADRVIRKSLKGDAGGFFDRLCRLLPW